MLEGEPCGEYALVVTQPNEVEGQMLCHAGHEYTGQIGFNQEVELELWHSHAADEDLEVSCFVWCTEDGELPQEPPATDISTDLIVAIVSKRVSNSCFPATKTFLPCR